MTTTRDAAMGTTTAIVERFRSDDDYAAAKALVRRALLDELPAEVQRDALVAYGEGKERGGWDETGFLGAMLVEGVWNAHDVIGPLLASDVFVTDNEREGVLQIVPRVGGSLRARVRAASDTLREYVALLAMCRAGSLALADGNIFLNNGTAQLWRRFTGVGAQDQLFDNTHARIGIGDSATAAARTQTDLQAAVNKTYKGMEAGFPTVTESVSGTEGSKATFKSAFQAAEGNHGHKEWVVDNKASGTPGVKVLNRKVQDFGLKESPAVWTYSLDTRID